MLNFDLSRQFYNMVDTIPKNKCNKIIGGIYHETYHPRDAITRRWGTT